MTGLRFTTKDEALERASILHYAGWFVYRLRGPDGFELMEKEIKACCLALREEAEQSLRRRRERTYG